jgi:spore coat polysaccharide biosynthesis protein SpsF
VGDTAAVTDAIVVVQARASSTRLPGKVLADVCGEPMLALMLHRVARSARAGEIVVATSDHPEDDGVAELAQQAGARVHRGSLDDVLGRFAGAVGDHDGAVVRITGDCPLMDPAVVDAAIELLDSIPGCVYASNVEPRTYPDGVDVEAFPAAILRELDATVTDPVDREHVTLALRRQLASRPHAALEAPDDGTLADARWTVDHPQDLEFVRAVVARLGERRHVAGVLEIAAAIERAPALSCPTPSPT